VCTSSDFPRIERVRTTLLWYRIADQTPNPPRSAVTQPSAEGVEAGEVLTEDQGVHLVGALVGAHRLEVRGMPDR